MRELPFTGSDRRGRLLGIYGFTGWRPMWSRNEGRYVQTLVDGQSHCELYMRQLGVQTAIRVQLPNGASLGACRALSDGGVALVWQITGFNGPQQYIGVVDATGVVPWARELSSPGDSISDLGLTGQGYLVARTLIAGNGPGFRRNI